MYEEKKIKQKLSNEIPTCNPLKAAALPITSEIKLYILPQLLVFKTVKRPNKKNEKKNATKTFISLSSFAKSGH